MCGESFRSRPVPQPAPGGHDVSSVSGDDARAFLSAYLNNQPGELERLRARLAPATVAKTPAQLAEAQADAAYDLANFIEGRVFEDEDHGEELTIELDSEDADELRGLVDKFVRARRPVRGY